MGAARCRLSTRSGGNSQGCGAKGSGPFMRALGRGLLCETVTREMKLPCFILRCPSAFSPFFMSRIFGEDHPPAIDFQTPCMDFIRDRAIRQRLRVGISMLIVPVFFFTYLSELWCLVSTERGGAGLWCSRNRLQP